MYEDRNAPNSQTEMRQIPKQECAKFPNENAPNSQISQESNAIGIKSLLDGAVHFPVTNFSNASNFSRSRGSALISNRLPCWSNSLYVGNEFTLR